MPATVDRLRTYMAATPARPVDEVALELAVNAANSWIAAVRTDLPPWQDTDATWPAHVDYAALIQATRLYARRGSAQGIAAFQDAGVSLLANMDPDVRVMLELGDYQPSATA